MRVFVHESTLGCIFEQNFNASPLFEDNPNSSPFESDFISGLSPESNSSLTLILKSTESGTLSDLCILIFT